MAPPPFAYVYVLLSQKDRKLYVGYTTDLKERVRRHQAGFVPATSSRLPVTLIFYEAFLNKYDALRRERYFKTTKGKRSLRQMLKEYTVASRQHMFP